MLFHCNFRYVFLSFDWIKTIIIIIIIITVDEELANIVNSLFKDLTPDAKTQAKVDQYPRPVNIEGLRAPQVNPLIWSQLPAQVRTQVRATEMYLQHLVVLLE